MPTGKILVLLDDTLASVKTLEFTLKHFNTGTNLITGLKLNRKHAGKELVSLATGIHVEESSLEPSEELANSLLEIKSILNQRFRLLDLGRDELNSLYQQSRYADLLITTKANHIDFVEPMLSTFKEKAPNIPLNCMYLTVPENIDSMDNVVLVNDNSEGALNAIKGFCRLFTERCKTASITLVNYIDNDFSEEENTYSLKLLATYLRAHCDALAIHRYKGEDAQFLSKLLDINERSLIVKGAGVSIHKDQAFYDVSQVLTIGGMI